MLRLLFTAALFGLLAAYLVKMLSAGRRSAPPPAGKSGPRHRIRTDGLSVRDAEFSEMDGKEGGRV
ncbi:MAG: hypothetical protein V1913_13145 [Fibrobacterota bacterium]